MAVPRQRLPEFVAECKESRSFSFQGEAAPDGYFDQLSGVEWCCQCPDRSSFSAQRFKRRGALTVKFSGVTIGGAGGQRQ